MITINILTGSVRPTRFNLQPAQWIANIAKQRDDITVNLIDLKEVNLPFLDENETPMSHSYEHDYTKVWSKTIAEADGFIFVTPEYNHSVSPVLKNAVDYLFDEWHHKPVSFVSYGSLAGGSRAVEHWRGIAAELKLYDLREQVMLPNYWEHLNEQGEYKFTDAHVTVANTVLDELIFWATQMKEARQKLEQ